MLGAGGREPKHFGRFQRRGHREHVRCRRERPIQVHQRHGNPDDDVIAARVDGRFCRPDRGGGEARAAARVRGDLLRERPRLGDGRLRDDRLGTGMPRIKYDTATPLGASILNLGCFCTAL